MFIRPAMLVCACLLLGSTELAGQGAPGSPPVTTRIPAEKASRARLDAARLARIETHAEEGWSKSPVDPTPILQAFDALRLKKDMMLRAYLFREGGNGNGVVWALPEGSAFPEPERGLGREVSLRHPPRPPAALDDAMLAIVGDDTPWSYLSASLLGRQFKAFGAMWHGESWGTHEILGENPVTSGSGRKRTVPIGKPVDWRWREPEPRDWNPSVAVGADGVVVVFYTYSALGQQTITRHTDTFKAGSYVYSTRTDEVAQGPGGFVF